MKAIVKENINFTRENFMDFGWGNGYVIIPKEHKLYGKDYDEIQQSSIPTLEINGGLTFSAYAQELDWPEIPEKDKDGWVVGFDTMHAWDTLEAWSKEKVLEEAENLKQQLEKF